MSYDLLFWREVQGANLDPQSVLEQLEEGEEFDGIIPLPLKVVTDAFKRSFPKIALNGTGLDWEGEGSYFQVEFIFLDGDTVLAISISCGYQLLKSDSAMNALGVVAHDLGCRVHDLQS